MTCNSGFNVDPLVSVCRAFDILKLEPENGNLTLAIAMLYRGLGDSQLALDFLDRTFKINPAYASYCHDKAKILYGMKLTT